jgi:phytoene/squalene synthetase
VSQQACASLVEQGDPDRFRAVLAAGAGLRGGLFTLYAFNLEIARAPWVTREPMIAEMRLQWWRDVVAEPSPRAHEVAAPFHDLIQRHNLPIPVIDRLIAARLWEVWHEPFADPAALWDYLRATSGDLCLLAGRISGGQPATDSLIQDHGAALGMAHFLRAVPALMAHDLSPLPDPAPSAVAQLAIQAQDVLRRTTPQINRLPRPQREAFFPGWQARALLSQAAAQPERVLSPGIALSPFRQSLGLVWCAFTGRV